jgi:TolA-binding protein
MQQVRNWSRMLSVAWSVWVIAGLAPPCGAAEAAGQSPQDALILYGDAASFQNNGAFDLAAEEWQKFLQKFPKDPLAAKAQH